MKSFIYKLRDGKYHVFVGGCRWGIYNTRRDAIGRILRYCSSYKSFSLSCYEQR